MKTLTLHILDVAQGESAQQIAFEVEREIEGQWRQVACGETAMNGRFEPCVLADKDFPTGAYRLRLAVGDYFDRQGVAQGTPKFFDKIEINFQAGAESIHLPILITPWSFSVYRGC